MQARPPEAVIRKYPLGVRLGLSRWRGRVAREEISGYRRYIYRLRLFHVLLLLFVTTVYAYTWFWY
jgi:hypothetical protein